MIPNPLVQAHFSWDSLLLFRLISRGTRLSSLAGQYCHLSWDKTVYGTIVSPLVASASRILPEPSVPCSEGGMAENVTELVGLGQDFAQTPDYEVVVIGAGDAGIYQSGA